MQTLGKCHGVGPAFLQGWGWEEASFAWTSCPLVPETRELLSASGFDVWDDRVSFQILTVDDLLFLTWLVAEQELADLERWKQQNRAKPVHLVPQRLGEWQTESQSR